MTIKGDDAPEAQQGEQGNPGLAISDLADRPALDQAEPKESPPQRTVRRGVVEQRRRARPTGVASLGLARERSQHRVPLLFRRLHQRTRLCFLWPGARNFL